MRRRIKEALLLGDVAPRQLVIDRSSSAKTDARPTTRRTIALTAGSSANRVQADCSYLQSTQYFDTDLPEPAVTSNPGKLRDIFVLHHSSPITAEIDHYRTPLGGLGG